MAASHKNEHISDFLATRIAEGDFPSAVYLVAERGEVVFTDALGNAVVEPEPIEARLETVYDLASITKVLVTGLLAASLVEKGELRTEDRIGRYLSELAGEKGDIRLVELLSHVSGLQGWLPLYLLTSNKPDTVVKVIAERPSEYERGTKVVYSDLNFILLQHIIEAVTGVSIDEAARARIFEPLGLQFTGFEPLRDTLLTRIAASEKGNRYEKQTCIDLGYIQPEDAAKWFREDVIWGEVHDGNAYFMGGAAGHAGLFSTADEVLKLALQFLPGYTQLLEPGTCELFRTNFTGELNEHRSFAFQMASTPESAAGPKIPPESFGHLGFTGTSLWIDPVNERIFILLTNRTHDHDLPFVNINSVRRRFHELATEALDRK